MLRKIDELGRIVLPIEMRNQLDVEERSSLNIEVDGDRFILTPVGTKCKICGSEASLREIVFGPHKTVHICESCIRTMRNLAPLAEK